MISIKVYLPLLFFILDVFLKNYFYTQGLAHLNTGISFSFFQNSNFIFAVISFIVLLIIGYLLFKLKSYRFLLALIFLGALSNFIDRLFYNGVIDYINFFGLFHNNIADIMIFVGSSFLLLKLFSNN